MSTSLELSLDQYAKMVERGAFDHLSKKIELIRGKIRQTNPAGPVHDDLIAYLTAWCFRAIDPSTTSIRVQTGLDLAGAQSRPEPDLMWVKAGRYTERHPTAADVELAIEVADSSLQGDLSEKALLYAEVGVTEYWVVDVRSRCIHVYRKPHSIDGYQDRGVFKAGETLGPASPRCNDALEIAELFDY
ncbi:MAG TPA: Uma2 family endonuclease [Planctomycetaceae bacterium]|nr:Uma2 family endonuclease [Planctomycetaceae bacterium]